MEKHETFSYFSRSSSASRSENSEDQEGYRSNSKDSLVISDDSEVEEIQANKRNFKSEGNKLN